MEELDLLVSLKHWRASKGGEDALLMEALARSAAVLRGLTGLSDLPDALAPAALELAEISLNQRGREGERSRTEGSLSVTLGGLSDASAALVRRFIPARIGYAHAP